nr:glycosyltransferase [Bacteroides intestinalis]
MFEDYKVAVLLPVYKKDNPTYLSIAIDSILGQTYSNICLFIGVDGYINKELEMCLLKYEALEKVCITRFLENRGLAVVLNDLITLCRREGFDYIARMDADDIALPDRLKEQMYYLLLHDEIDVVGGAIEEIDETGNLRGKRIVYPLEPEACRRFFAYRNPLAHPAVLFRYRFFEKTGCLYRPEYRQNQDTLLWYDGLLKKCNIANVPNVVLHFRMTNDLFKKRRNGFAFAKKSLKDRFMINKGLGYGLHANLFAVMIFLITISPVWLKKLAYRVR